MVDPDFGQWQLQHHIRRRAAMMVSCESRPVLILGCAGSTGQKQDAKRPGVGVPPQSQAADVSLSCPPLSLIALRHRWYAVQKLPSGPIDDNRLRIATSAESSKDEGSSPHRTPPVAFTVPTTVAIGS